MKSKEGSARLSEVLEPKSDTDSRVSPSTGLPRYPPPSWEQPVGLAAMIPVGSPQGPGSVLLP